MSKLEVIKRIERVAKIIALDARNPDNVEKAKEIMHLTKLLNEDNNDGK